MEEEVQGKTKKTRVLVVDDDVSARMIMEKYLVPKYQFFSAENGPAALEMAHKLTPDIIFLDIMMPHMDGYEVCRQLKKDPHTAEIPVIFLTAMGQERDKALAFQVGASGYLVKPAKKEVMLASLEERLLIREQWRQLMQSPGPLQKSPNPPRYQEFLGYLGEKEQGWPDFWQHISQASEGELYAIATHARISEREMARNIAEFLQLPFFPEIDPEDIALGRLPTNYCQSMHVVALESPSPQKQFAVSNPFDPAAMDQLEEFNRYEEGFEIGITPPQAIDRLFQHPQEE